MLTNKKCVSSLGPAVLTTRSCWSLHEDCTVLGHVIVCEGDVTQLCSFYSTLHNAVAMTKSLGYSLDLASSTNTRAALQKLPDRLKEKWRERKIEIHPTIPTLVDLYEWLH